MNSRHNDIYPDHLYLSLRSTFWSTLNHPELSPFHSFSGGTEPLFPWPAGGPPGGGLGHTSGVPNTHCPCLTHPTVYMVMVPPESWCSCRSEEVGKNTERPQAPSTWMPLTLFPGVTFSLFFFREGKRRQMGKGVIIKGPATSQVLSSRAWHCFNLSQTLGKGNLPFSRRASYQEGKQNEEARWPRQGPTATFSSWLPFSSSTARLFPTLHKGGLPQLCPQTLGKSKATL